MFDDYPLYEMELTSYHACKRTSDSQATFEAYHQSTSPFQDNIINSLLMHNDKSISAAISLLKSALLANEVFHSHFDFVFIYRGMANAPFDALESCIFSLLKFSKRILVISPELNKASDLFHFTNNSSFFIVDASTLESLSKLLLKHHINSFAPSKKSSQTFSTVLVASFCSAMHKISTEQKLGSTVYCQFGYSGGFRLFNALMQSYSVSPNVLWHSTKYNSRIFGNTIKYSSGSRSKDFIFMPTMFLRVSSSFRQQYQLKRDSRLLSDKDLIVCSISRPEKILIDERFSLIIRQFLELTPDTVRYRLYSDNTSSSRIFVDRIIASAPQLEQRLEIVDQFKAHQLLDQYVGIDLFLDPFPFSAGLTLFRALDLSLPVVSLLEVNNYYSNSLNRKFYDLLGDSIFAPNTPFVSSVDRYLKQALTLCNSLLSRSSVVESFRASQDSLFSRICSASDVGLQSWITSVS